MMKPHSGPLLVCNCQRTMSIDGRQLAACLGRAEPLIVHSELCRGQMAQFEAAAKAAADAGETLTIACTQEAALFGDAAAGVEGEGPPPVFVNIRERAGWGEAQAAAVPKMAALLAEAAHVGRPAGLLTMTSAGVCLLLGAGQAALDAAVELSGRLDVTLLFTDPADALPPLSGGLSVARGRVRSVRGTLGNFEVEVDGYAPALPSSRGAYAFTMPRNGAKSTCDLILDLTGGTPLFADHARRDGYLRADPNSPLAVAKALMKAADLVGEFEKPIYVGYDAAICAHARSRKVGCSRCIDNCPTGAITPNEDKVAIDALICGGCGACSAVCPTGAVSSAYPRREDLVARVQILIGAFLATGGASPVLLMHDASHGLPLISAIARFGRGLPANVLPIEVFSVTSVGHDVLAAALASGAGEVLLLAPDRPHELPALEEQIALGSAILAGLGYAGPRLRLITDADPDVVEAALYARGPFPDLAAHAFTSHGGKRELARTALLTLHAAAPTPVPLMPLPKGAPYGRIEVEVDGCTLCLACVGACPVNALADNPDRPELSFTEAACVQCGICVATCPEQVISLEPRLNFQSSAMTPVVLKVEEPFNCVRCGKPFGTKSSIARVSAALKGKHAMFKSEAQMKLIEMCNNCRVIAMSEEGIDPFAGAARPKIRTTDDYLAEAAALKAKPRKPDDFLN